MKNETLHLILSENKNCDRVIYELNELYTRPGFDRVKPKGWI